MKLATLEPWKSCDIVDNIQACIAWLKHEPHERKQYIYKILKHVRLPLVSRYSSLHS